MTTFTLSGRTIRIIKPHWNGLVMGIIGWVLGWYSLVLITADVNNGQGDKFFIKPTTIQNWGILAAVLMGIVTWFQRLLTVQGDTSEQG